MHRTFNKEQNSATSAIHLPTQAEWKAELSLTVIKVSVHCTVCLSAVQQSSWLSAELVVVLLTEVDMLQCYSECDMLTIELLCHCS